MRLSTQLELSKICKTKGLVFAKFSSESVNSSFHWWKNSQKFVEQIFQHNICKKWDIYWQKTCWGCLWKLKFGTQVYQFVLKKTPQNNFFHRCKHHCQNGIWNIKIFASIFSLSYNILQGKFVAKLKKLKVKVTFTSKFCLK